MRCTCELARREARAEAFREAAKWHAEKRAFWEKAGVGFPTYNLIRAAMHRQSAAFFAVLAGTKCAPAGSPARGDIVDCVEDDGFITAHVTDTDPSWPSEDGGLDG